MKMVLTLTLSLFCFSAFAVPVGYWCNGSDDCDEGALCVESVPYVWVCMTPDSLSVSSILNDSKPVQNISAEREDKNLIDDLPVEEKVLAKDIQIDCADNAGISHHGEFDIDGITDFSGFRRVYHFLATKCLN
jgi:hypothetical protein